MTVRLRHKGCASVAIVYHGEEPLEKHPPLRARDWARPDGSGFTAYTKFDVLCPDCGERLWPTFKLLEPIQKAPAEIA